MSTKISEMTAATDLTGAVVPIVQGGVNKKADANLLGASGYKVYTALLSQTGTDAPTATVLQNTLGGNPVFTYVGVGEYNITLTNAFPENKTFYLTSPTGGSGQAVVELNREDNNTILVLSFSVSGAELADQILEKTPVEIRIYP
jgi:hypothetical protein